MSEDTRSNPYVGLRPFFRNDALYFFGRDAQIEELLVILRSNRFLGVVGSSGSGKSSLVRAGLVPALLGGFLVQDRDAWRRVSIKPGDAPLANLAAGLVAAMSGDPDAEAQAGSPAAQSLEAAIRAGHTEAVLDFVRPRLEANANLFLLVDQFEEIFAFRGVDDSDDAPDADPARRQERARRKDEASDFVDLMLGLAAQAELPIYVVLTMRTDFLGDCDLFYGLPEALNRGRYLVPRLTREQLRDAIECPALLAGAEVAPRLLDHVLNALGDRFDRLPVLQHALMRTFDAWRADGGTGAIDLKHFEAAGGLEDALNRDAERALAGLDPAAVELIFRRLTDTDIAGRRIRSPARLSELAAAANVDRATVEAVAARYEGDGRSFVHASPDGRPDDPRLDISHESLIRQWQRLRDWVDAERGARDTFVDLVARAGRYARDEATSLRGPELRLARNWKKTVRPTPGWAARYARHDDDFKRAMRYLNRSIWNVRLWRVAAVGTVAGTFLILALAFLTAQDTIDTSIAHTDRMVASLYRKLEPIGGTTDARRELIEQSVELNKKLNNDGATDSNLFWSTILLGDAIIDKAIEAWNDAPRDTKAAEEKAGIDYDAQAKLATKKYESAVELANGHATADPTAYDWFENLATALTKLAAVTLDEGQTDKAYVAAIKVNEYLKASNPQNRSYAVALSNAYLQRSDWYSTNEWSRVIDPALAYDLAVKAYCTALDAYTLSEKACDNPDIKRNARAGAPSTDVMTALIDAGLQIDAVLAMPGEPWTKEQLAIRNRLGPTILEAAKRRTDIDPQNLDWKQAKNDIAEQFNLQVEATKQGDTARRAIGRSR